MSIPFSFTESSIGVESKSYEGYRLKDEGDNRNIDFNFAAAGDFGCSENAINTVKNMEEKNLSWCYLWEIFPMREKLTLAG
jgi:hypothetical protein